MGTMNCSTDGSLNGITIVSIESPLSENHSERRFFANSTRYHKLDHRKSHSIKEKIANETEKFFGFCPTFYELDETDWRIATDEEERKWQQRRFRHLSKQFEINTNAVAVELHHRAAGGSDLPNNIGRQTGSTAEEKLCTTLNLSSSITNNVYMTPIIEKRESVAQMVVEVFYAVLQGKLFRELKRQSNQSIEQNISSSLFGPAMSITAPSSSMCVTSKTPVLFSQHRHQYKSIRDRKSIFNGVSSFPLLQLNNNSNVYEQFEEQHNHIGNNRRKKSKWRKRSQLLNLSFIEKTQPTIPLSARSFIFREKKESPKFVYSFFPSVTDNDVFFDISLCDPCNNKNISDKFFKNSEIQRQAAAGDEKFSSFKILPSSCIQFQYYDSNLSPNNVIYEEYTESSNIDEDNNFDKKFRNFNFDKFKSNVMYNDKTIQKENLPIFGRLKHNRMKSTVARQLKDVSCDYRPFFTYWVTTVQLIIMLVMLFRYGIGSDFTNGVGVIQRSGNVMASYLSFVRIIIWEQNNVWIGPRFANLVHAGAKYSPCMRYDRNIYEQILRERSDESQYTGCCIGPDGCFQTSECPKQFARFKKWLNHSANSFVVDNNLSSKFSESMRIVCGQDPRYCKKPQYIHPFKWDAKNISNWSICEETTPKELIPQKEDHMHCEITGRPCCIQMHGQCRITTKAYCDFVRGYYHPEATLCSQVSCLYDVCGMTSFVHPDSPNQIYRLVTPLFLHAGVIRYAITFILQMTVMREFEVMIGWLRLSLIYFISGIGGYLASAVFVPYMPEVGPAGSQGGILGALIINVLYNWNFLCHPKQVLLYHLMIATLLFVTGILPYVDNWAQFFGFIFGGLLAAALIPYITFGKRRTRRKRILIVVLSLSISLILFIVLFALFFAYPTAINYEALSSFNCPFKSKVCDHQSLILKSWLPI